MYNDPSAKDLLAQYPRQLAEGGTVEQSWQAPAVKQRTTTLTPIYAPDKVPAGYTGDYIDPTVLSSSQQSARDRAAQDAMLARAIQSTGSSQLGGLNYRQLQQAVRSGDITETNLQEKVVNPVYEQRVRNAYAALGRTGAVLPEIVMPATGKPTAANYQNVTQAEYDNWANQLKTGTLSGADFQNAFLKANATTIPTTNLEAQMTYVNRARAALGMPLIDKNGKVVASPAPTAAKTTTTVQPIDLSGNTQMFNQGGTVAKKRKQVGHPNEYVDTVARWGRKGQEGFATMIGLGDEVKFANKIPEFYFPKDEQLDGRGDAMRHMLLQAQITKKLGRTPAEIASYIHENWLTGGQSKAEEEMDKANDALGMDIGARSADKADMAWKALQAIEAGQAKTIADKTTK